MRCRFSILWHHGAWGGEVLQGLGGAERFAFKIRYPWDVFCFGHNHKTNTRFYDMIDFTQRGNQIYAPVAIIGCGTYLKTLSGDDQPDYAEQRGYPPVHLGSPLINIKVLSDPDKNSGRYLRWRVIND